MNHAPYDDIALWYDNYLRENSIYQDVVLPCLWELTGDVQGRTICDLARGQGWFTRELAKRGTQVRGIDLAENLLTLARQYEEQEPHGIIYQQDDVVNAPKPPQFLP